MFSSPTIAGGILIIGSHQGKLIAIDLKTQNLAWEFQTDASKENLPRLTKADGSENAESLFSEDFYEAMVSGADKEFTALGSIISSPVAVDNVVYVGSTDGYLYALM